MSFQRVSADNFISNVLGFIQKNSMIVETFDDIQDVYLSMLRGRYFFTIERDLIMDMLSDLVYYLNPSDEINRIRVVDSITPDDGEDENDIIDLPE